jgi:Zn-dependent peptidase ImmA (M78 family)
VNVDELARRAVRAAGMLRAKHGIGAAAPLCPFDFAQRLGITVRMVSLPSLEGMYTSGPPPTILVSTNRPSGRRRYTCGHEIAHHIFGHGTRLDELDHDKAKSWNPDEFLAQRFAAALLMPKLAVGSAFARRHWIISRPTNNEVFVVAQDLGVGYATLIHYLHRVLNCIAAPVATTLLKVPVRRLRSQIAGFTIEHDLVVADEHWGGRPIDIEIGDVVLLPRAAKFEGNSATLQSDPVPHLQAVAPGVGAVRFVRDLPPIAVRVSRREYAGLARYRHLEDAGDDD